MTLELIISKDGVCRQVLGQTRGFDNPEELLEAIGLGHLDKEEKSRDQLGVSYTIPYRLIHWFRFTVPQVWFDNTRISTYLDDLGSVEAKRRTGIEYPRGIMGCLCPKAYCGH